MSKHRFILLDGLRGLAALGIVIHHIGKAYYPMLDGLYLLVDFFFVLSGFVLHPSLPVAGPDQRQNTRLFIARRFIRFWPMVGVVLVFRLMLWVQWTMRHQPDVTSGHSPALTQLPISFVGAVLLLQIVVPSAAQWTGALWSLSAEWWSNLFAIPFAASRRSWSLFMGLAVGYALLAIGWALHQPAIFGARALGRAIVGFFIGMIARAVFDQKSKPSSSGHLVISLGLVAMFFVYQQHFRSGGLLIAAPLFAYCIVQVARINQVNVPSPVLATSTFLGTVSFGIYAWHPNMYMLLASTPFPMTSSGKLVSSVASLFVVSFIVAASSIGMTLLTSRYVERPLKSRWTHLVDRRLTRAS
jgi:peptidoglycan/LPS O-acetylase OafA/YrhL